MASATKYLAAVVNFGALTGHVGTLTVIAVSLHSASSGGTLYAYGPVGAAIPVNSGDAISFAANAIVQQLIPATNCFIADADAMAYLDARYGSGSPATIYVGLYTTGAIEFVGGTYARVAITNNNTNFPAASMV